MLPPVVFILPALNEEQSITQVLDHLNAKIAAMGLGAKILVVDNGSADATSRVAAAHGATLIPEPRRRRLQGLGQSPGWIPRRNENYLDDRALPIFAGKLKDL
jgi:glycosyltransferase involved in cell wall biosynthesis